MSLKTTHPLALSRLLSDELYLIKDEISAKDNVPQREEAAPAKDENKPEPPSFVYLGENNKYFLILVDQPGETHINKEDQADLEKILKAMGMELRDTAIMNLAAFPATDFTQLKAFFACSRLVLFGVDPARLNLPAVPGNQISMHQGVKILATFSFKEMQGDRNKKASFWNEMKKI